MILNPLMSSPIKSDLPNEVSMVIPSLFGYVWKGAETDFAAEEAGEFMASSFQLFELTELLEFVGELYDELADVVVVVLVRCGGTGLPDKEFMSK